MLDGGQVAGKTEQRFTILGSPRKLEIDGVLPNLSNNANPQQEHSPIIGWALDGAPIYGPYGFSIPNDSSSPITNLTSGYTRLDASSLPVNSIRRQNTSPGLLANYPMGSFAEDYVFSETVGDWILKMVDMELHLSTKKVFMHILQPLIEMIEKMDSHSLLDQNLKEKYIMTLIFEKLQILTILLV